MKTVFYGVLAFLLLIAAIVGLIVYGGFAVSLLWGWLIVPTFSVPAITVVQGVGIALFVSYFLRGVAMQKLEQDEDESVAEKCVNALGKSFFTISMFIGMGWVVSLFM